MDNKYKYMRAAAHITQFGLDMVTPVVLCVIIAASLKNAFNIGNWVVILAIIIGVACTVLNMFKFIKNVNKESGGDKGDKKS